MVQDAVPQLIHMCQHFTTTITVTLADQINFFSSFQMAHVFKKVACFLQMHALLPSLYLVLCQKGHSYPAKCEAWKMAIRLKKKQFWENILESLINKEGSTPKDIVCNCFHC